MSKLIHRTNYLDKTIDFLVSDIIEYDMKEAGFNIIKEKRLLPDEVITSLTNKYDKKQRTIEIGKIRRKNKKFSNEFKEAFVEFREKFINLNDIEDEDILSIKNDALFIKKYCYNLKMGEYVEFAEKHIYNAYMNLNNLEIYWSNNGQLDIKGILDTHIVPHEEYMIKFLWGFIKRLSSYDKDGTIKYLIKFMDDYKHRRLPVGYYRTLNNTPVYNIIINDKIQSLDDISSEYLSLCDISYNYIKILTPLLGYVV